MRPTACVPSSLRAVCLDSKAWVQTPYASPEVLISDWNSAVNIGRFAESRECTDRELYVHEQGERRYLHLQSCHTHRRSPAAQAMFWAAYLRHMRMHCGLKRPERRSCVNQSTHQARRAELGPLIMVRRRHRVRLDITR